MSASVQLQPHSDGVLLPVLARPRSKRNAIVGVYDGRLKIAVTAVPEKGRANAAIIEVLCDALGLKRSQIRLLVGKTDSRKTLLIADVTLEELSQRLTSAVDSA